MAAETSPLFASDRAVADNIGRSSTSYGLGRNGANSFPIKKIAFRQPPAAAAGEDNPDSDAAPSSNSNNNNNNNSASDTNMTSAQIRARKQQQEEFEVIKREAREAGMRGKFRYE